VGVVGIEWCGLVWDELCELIKGCHDYGLNQSYDRMIYAYALLTAQLPVFSALLPPSRYEAHSFLSIITFVICFFNLIPLFSISWFIHGGSTLSKEPKSPA
jgi:hypothetical protein